MIAVLIYVRRGAWENDKGLAPNEMISRDAAKKLALRLLPNFALAQLKKVHYANVLRRASGTDEPDLTVVRYLVQPGQIVVDIGANIGIYTKFLSQCVGPSGKVISVEPIPLTFDILRSNVRKLRLRNVQLENFAISDIEGPVTMHVPTYRTGGENFYEARIGTAKIEGSRRSFEVSAITLDALLSEALVVHFVKCDVEGHELNCIRGAMRTLERSRPAWLIEVSGDMDNESCSAHQMHSILAGYGYAPFWVHGDKLEPQRYNAKPVNFFFLTNLHVKHLRERGLGIES